jgi:hypothetical protein
MRTSRVVGWLGAVLLGIVVLGLVAWAFRDDLLQRWNPAVEYTEVSPEAAASAEEKLERLRTRGDTVRLSEVELASYLRFRLAEQYSDLLRNPAAGMAGDTIRLGGSLPTERLPNLQELERVRAFLPDTTRVDIAGRLTTQQPGRGVIEIGEVAVAGVPVPPRYYPSVLERIGRRDEPGLAENALAFPLPQGVGTARVEGGYLILTP